MATFERRTRMPVSAQALYDWHARPGAFERLNPPFAPAEIEERSGGLEVGARTVIRLPVGPVKTRWVAEHTALEPGRMFRDEQREGPFSKWVHTHRFEPIDDTSSELVDHLEYELPMGALGQVFGGPFAEAKLEQTFAYRHALTRADLVRHQQFAAAGPKTFAVTGASGLIGSALLPFLSTGGHRAVAVKRSGGTPDVSTLEGPEVVVNLAGAGVADARWTDARKRELLDSRVRYTDTLRSALEQRGSKPSVWVQASAIGIYGDRGDEALTEASVVGPAGSEKAEFLTTICLEWEEAGRRAAEAFGARFVALRIGLVQAANGGALGKQLPVFKAGAGGPLGDGRGWQSWVSLEDVLGLIHFAALTDSVEGAVNVTAPHPVRSAEYAKTLGRVLHRPAIAPVPAFALKAMFGELAEGALLVGAKALPQRAQAAGFRFLHPMLEDALHFTLGS